MKVLHLFGDWKWTGPAEPTLDLCVELRSAGTDVILVCQPPPPERTTNLPDRARERGIDPVFTSLAFNRKFNIRDNVTDIDRVRQLCDEHKPDILHVHFTHDHIIGALGARRASGRPLVVRTNHKGTSLPWIVRRMMDGYLTFSRGDLARRPPRCPSRRIAPGMRLERFDPGRPMQDMRTHFGIAGDAFVVGVVARMQRHRRFGVLLEGIRQARARVPGLRVLIVGRGTHMKSVAVEPVRQMGLEDTVRFTGYVSDRYVDTVAAFDALLFLVPGSDGTCRALREAMAMGKASIGARRGLIPEIVEDGDTGLVIEDTPDGIAAAIESLARNRERCRAMGARARAKALATYDIRRQARDVGSFYEELIASRAALTGRTT